MLHGTGPALRTAFTDALLPASRTWPLSSMCFIVFKILKCVTHFFEKNRFSSKKPIAPKSNAAFYGAAKIDKLFKSQKITAIFI
jgi:hypothetical protein